MDERTIQRYLAGDSEAAQAVEESLRDLATKLLRFDGFQISDSVQLKVLATAAAREAMERGARNSDGLHAGALLAAARRGIESYRRVTHKSSGEGHLPPAALVSVALVPNAMPSPSLAAAEKHLASCEDCALQMELIRDATAAATAPKPSEQGTSAPLESTGPEVKDQPVTPSASIPAKSRPLSSPSRPGEKHRSLHPSRSMALRRADVRTGPSRGALTPFLLLVLIGLIAWYFIDRSNQAARSRDTALAALADRTPPPVPPEASRDPALIAAFQDLSANECRTAATRFRKARLASPSLTTLFYEGASWVCAGEGEKALEVFEKANAMPGRPPEGFTWYYLQAALLAGDRDLASRLLFDLETSRSPYQSRAQALRAKLSDLPR